MLSNQITSTMNKRKRIIKSMGLHEEAIKIKSYVPYIPEATTGIGL